MNIEDDLHKKASFDQRRKGTEENERTTLRDWDCMKKSEWLVSAARVLLRVDALAVRVGGVVVLPLPAGEEPPASLVAALPQLAQGQRVVAAGVHLEWERKKSLRI